MEVVSAPVVGSHVTEAVIVQDDRTRILYSFRVPKFGASRSNVLLSKRSSGDGHPVTNLEAHASSWKLDGRIQLNSYEIILFLTHSKLHYKSYLVNLIHSPLIFYSLFEALKKKISIITCHAHTCLQSSYIHTHTTSTDIGFTCHHIYKGNIKAKFRCHILSTLCDVRASHSRKSYDLTPFYSSSHPGMDSYSI